jgi:hypothetical protein
MKALSTYAGKVSTRGSCYEGGVDVAVHAEYRILPFGHCESEAYSIRGKKVK